MTLTINSKSVVQDTNTNISHQTVTNQATLEMFLTVQSQYIIRMTCYDYIPQEPATAVVKSFQAGDKFMCVLGNQRWQDNALVKVPDSKFNNVADWSAVNPNAGKICFKLSLNQDELLHDISGLANKEYAMQVWCIDQVTNLPYLVSNTKVTMLNVTVEI